MRNGRFFGGIILLLVAAGVFVFEQSDATIPVAITLTVVGVVLIASSRRRMQS